MSRRPYPNKYQKAAIELFLQANPDYKQVHFTKVDGVAFFHLIRLEEVPLPAISDRDFYLEYLAYAEPGLIFHRLILAIAKSGKEQKTLRESDVSQWYPHCHFPRDRVNLDAAFEELVAGQQLQLGILSDPVLFAFTPKVEPKTPPKKRTRKTTIQGKLWK